MNDSQKRARVNLLKARVVRIEKSTMEPNLKKCFLNYVNEEIKAVETIVTREQELQNQADKGETEKNQDLEWAKNDDPQWHSASELSDYSSDDSMDGMETEVDDDDLMELMDEFENSSF